MKPDIVVDVGNSRIKWGRCTPDAVAAAAALPHDPSQAWQEQLNQWRLPGPLRWVVSGVQPRICDAFLEWIRRRGDKVHFLEFPRQLPLAVHVEHPDRVGIDRLLDAVAVNHRRTPGTPAVVIDAGSAITVDYVDSTGAFRGGAILPGLRLMARALHDHTALLPLVELQKPLPPALGPSTTAALEAGVYWAAAGGIQALLDHLTALDPTPPEIFLGGGDAGLLAPALPGSAVLWPFMTLEGSRLAAEALP